MSDAKFKLLGWHNSTHNNNPRINKWVTNRQKALVKLMSSLPGGKDVASYMLQNGWFDFKSQIIPHQKVNIIRPNQLRYYEPVVLYLYYDPKHNRTRFALGLVDNRLVVYPMLFQTPVVGVHSESCLHPTSFCIRNNSFKIQLERLEKNIQKCFHHQHGIGPWFLLGNKLYGMPGNGYKRFDHTGKKLIGDIYYDDDAVVLFKVENIVTTQQQHTFEILIDKSIVQVQVDRSCRFTNDDDDDEVKNTVNNKIK